jgi:hypothetical protein
MTGGKTRHVDFRHLLVLVKLKYNTLANEIYFTYNVSIQSGRSLGTFVKPWLLQSTKLPRHEHFTGQSLLSVRVPAIKVIHIIISITIYNRNDLVAFASLYPVSDLSKCKLGFAIFNSVTPHITSRLYRPLSPWYLHHNTLQTYIRANLYILLVSWKNQINHSPHF